MGYKQQQTRSVCIYDVLYSAKMSVADNRWQHPSAWRQGKIHSALTTIHRCSTSTGRLATWPAAHRVGVSVESSVYVSGLSFMEESKLYTPLTCTIPDLFIYELFYLEFCVMQYIFLNLYSS